MCIRDSGYSDSEEDIRLLGENLGKYRQIQRVEILHYHRLGVHKYEAMGWDYKLKEVKETAPEPVSYTHLGNEPSVSKPSVRPISLRRAVTLAYLMADSESLKLSFS